MECIVKRATYAVHLQDDSLHLVKTLRGWNWHANFMLFWHSSGVSLQNSNLPFGSPSDNRKRTIFFILTCSIGVRMNWHDWVNVSRKVPQRTHGFPPFWDQRRFGNYRSRAKLYEPVAIFVSILQITIWDIINKQHVRHWLKYQLLHQKHFLHPLHPLPSLPSLPSLLFLHFHPQLHHRYCSPQVLWQLFEFAWVEKRAGKYRELGRSNGEVEREPPDPPQ